MAVLLGALLGALLGILGASLGDAAEAPPQLLGRSRSQWSDQLRDADPLRRVDAAWALAQLGDKAFNDLVEAAGHEDSAVRVWALRGLANAVVKESPDESRRSEALEIFRQSTDDDSPAVQTAAADALISLGDERGMSTIQRLLDHPSDQVRHHALLAIDREIDLPPAVLEKVDRQTDDSYEYTKRVAERIMRRSRRDR